MRENHRRGDADGSSRPRVPCARGGQSPPSLPASDTADLMLSLRFFVFSKCHRNEIVQ